MTINAITVPELGNLPGPDTLVLANRQLKPGYDPAQLSAFGDERWDLSPAIFENHMMSVRLNFAVVPAAFQEAAKHYIWAELNIEHPAVVLRRGNTRLAVYSMQSALRHLRMFLSYLDSRGMESICRVTQNDLDDYLGAVKLRHATQSERYDIIRAVRRLWALRDYLPAQDRLPQAPPWDGRDSKYLLGKDIRPAENLTPRVPENTMTPLLTWALRFVEDFSTDILAGLDEVRPLYGLQPGRSSGSRANGALELEIARLLDLFRSQNRPLPGSMGADGTIQPRFHVLAKLLDIRADSLQSRRHRSAILSSGIPFADGAHLATTPQATLDGQVWWTDHFDYDDIPELVQQLRTAAFLVTAYLSGMRPGEVLTLQRGCIDLDPVTGLRILCGRKWKGANDSNGDKLPEGQARDEPWIIAEPVARAIEVMERMHTEQILFPVSILHRGNRRHGQQHINAARGTGAINDDLNNFVTWINAYCQRRGRPDVVPRLDRPLTASRLRRTLAWFICRRPRGLVACAIQYGHIHTQITQGYSGSYSSGFPDEVAFEQWLTQLDELDDADRRIKTGEKVSGPAADIYLSRVNGGATRFAGRVIRSARQARAILANPSLQIYPGNAMTCVFDAAKALCQLSKGHGDTRTPDLDDCRTGCQNIARTDQDIQHLLAETETLRHIANDPLSPAIRNARERQRLQHLERVILSHEKARRGYADDDRDE